MTWQHITWQVQEIITEGSGANVKATGVKLADGRVFRGKTVISNATRWDTFEKMLGGEDKLPPSEQAFRKRYKKSPSFLSVHMGVKADVIPQGMALWWLSSNARLLADIGIWVCLLSYRHVFILCSSTIQIERSKAWHAMRVLMNGSWSDHKHCSI